jgi:hypothetical protein
LNNWLAASKAKKSGWHGWWPINGVSVPAGSFVSAVSRNTDKLDIFVTDSAGNVETAAWQPAFTDGWHGWFSVGGEQAAPGTPVNAVSRSTDKLDVFLTGTDHRVWSAAWEPDFTDGWHGWWPIGELPTGPTSIGPLETGYITFSGGTPVGGSASVTLWPDGTYVFQGTFHDSGFPSYNDQLVFVVKDNVTNTAYTCSHSGHVAGTVESGSRDDNWNVSSRSADLQNAYHNFADGWLSNWSAGVNADFNSIVDKALAVVGTVTGVVSIFAR